MDSAFNSCTWEVLRIAPVTLSKAATGLFDRRRSFIHESIFIFEKEFNASLKATDLSEYFQVYPNGGGEGHSDSFWKAAKLKVNQFTKALP